MPPDNASRIDPSDYPGIAVYLLSVLFVLCFPGLKVDNIDSIVGVKNHPVYFVYIAFFIDYLFFGIDNIIILKCEET